VCLSRVCSFFFFGFILIFVLPLSPPDSPTPTCLSPTIGGPPGALLLCHRLSRFASYVRRHWHSHATHLLIQVHLHSSHPSDRSGTPAGGTRTRSYQSHSVLRPPSHCDYYLATVHFPIPRIRFSPPPSYGRPSSVYFSSCVRGLLCGFFWRDLSLSLLFRTHPPSPKNPPFPSETPPQLRSRCDPFPLKIPSNWARLLPFIRFDDHLACYRRDLRILRPINFSPRATMSQP